MAFGIVRSDGWYITNTEGIATLYLSIVDEGYVTQSTDSPSSKVHHPRILNAESFNIRKSISFWPWGRAGASFGYGSLTLDNYDGMFNELLTADLRDATVIFHLPLAQAFGGASSLSSIDPIATAVLDRISGNDDTVTLTLKDPLSRYDRTLPCRFCPPFYDSNAANRMVPITLGACRNVEPLLIDQANRIYLLSDSPITNIAAMRDKGAPLSPSSDPPQYTPAMDYCGVQLDTLPEGKLTCDISSEGAQVVIPGDVDVLNGEGILDVWTTATDPPDNWQYITGTTNAHVVRFGTANSWSQDYVARLESAVTYNTSGANGRGIQYDTAVLKAGRTYRISFVLERWSGSQSASPTGTGFLLRSDISGPIYGAGAISGRYPLTAPTFGAQPYTFTYTVPSGADRTVYALAIGDPSYAPVSIGFSQLKIEELGEYVEAPVTGISLADFATEIFVNRDGQDSTVFSSSDLAAIDTAAGYLFGVHYESPPNILSDCLAPPLDSFCAGYYSDSDGVIRFARLSDPKDGSAIVDFDESNILSMSSVDPDNAKELTTIMGARRNWAVFGDSDFVTDDVQLSLDTRERYKRLSQYQQTSSIVPAGHYSHARNAPVFDSLLDEPDDAQAEIDRVVSLYSPRVYDDGTVTTGKRQFVRFEVLFDEQTAIGSALQCDVRDLLPGTIVSVTYQGSNDSPRYEGTKMLVASVELFPYAKKIAIEGWY
jgi:hypothetical protein